MHSRTVFPFDYIALTTDHLDGVETSVPDAYAGQCESSLEGPFHVHEEILLDYNGDNRGDEHGHGDYLPVVLVQEHADQLSEVNADLVNSSSMSVSHFPPPHLCFLRTAR